MFSELPVVSVHVPPALRGLVGGLSEVMGSGETVGEVLEAVAHRYPHWRAHVFNADGSLVDGVAVYLGAKSISERQGLATLVEAEECINVLPTDHASQGLEPLQAPAVAHAPRHDISIGD